MHKIRIARRLYLIFNYNISLLNKYQCIGYIYILKMKNKFKNEIKEILQNEIQK